MIDPPQFRAQYETSYAPKEASRMALAQDVAKRAVIDEIVDPLFKESPVLLRASVVHFDAPGRSPGWLAEIAFTPVPQLKAWAVLIRQSPEPFRSEALKTLLDLIDDLK